MQQRVEQILADARRLPMDQHIGHCIAAGIPRHALDVDEVLFTPDEIAYYGELGGFLVECRTSTSVRISAIRRYAVARVPDCLQEDFVRTAAAAVKFMRRLRAARSLQ
ncbi:hypothetical protein HY632_01120 [Candidatus Uhrbacteria bacterium]|nr:hypothetical protein [Candidatus Uhrbacteria bacterium]